MGDVVICEVPQVARKLDNLVEVINDILPIVTGSEKRGNFVQNAKFGHFSSCHHSKVPRAIGFILGL